MSMEKTRIEDFEKYIAGDKAGVISLAVPVLNITEWYGPSTPYYKRFLNMDESEIEAIAYYGKYVVREPGKSGFSEGEVITPKSCTKASQDDDAFSAVSGAEGIAELLKRVPAKELFDQYRQEETAAMKALNAETEPQSQSAAEEAAAISRYTRNRTQLENARAKIDAIYYVMKRSRRLFITSIDVIPLALRPKIRDFIKTVPYAIYDLEALYNRVLQRNARLIKLMNMGAPEVILRNEKRLLQEYVDTLIANGRRGIAWGSICDVADHVAAVSLSDVALHETELI